LNLSVKSAKGASRLGGALFLLKSKCWMKRQ
jgi:hypothetical protein